MPAIERLPPFMSSSHQARVTIGVPAYNAGRYLPQALDSLLAQTYTDLEIVVSDNASTDDTGDIAREYAARDPRVRYSRNPENIGAGRNFIRCVELARGELFRWASADDLSAPTFVERCVEVLDANPDVVQAYPRVTLIDSHGTALKQYDEKIQTLDASPRRRYLHVIRNIELVNALYGVMRTEILRKTSIHGTYLGADVVVQTEIALYGKIWEIPEYLFFRRFHPGAHSSMTPAEQQTFYNPKVRSSLSLQRWRSTGESVRAIVRSPISLRDKLYLTGAMLRGAVASREEFLQELVGAARERWSGPTRRT